MGMISDLYNGGTTIFENTGYVDTDEFRSLVDELQERERLLLERLDEKERTLYEDIKNLRLCMHLAETEQTFINAFRLGAILIIDIYNEH